MSSVCSVCRSNGRENDLVLVWWTNGVTGVCKSTQKRQHSRQRDCDENILQHRTSAQCKQSTYERVGNSSTDRRFKYVSNDWSCFCVYGGVCIFSLRLTQVNRQITWRCIQCTAAIKRFPMTPLNLAQRRQPLSLSWRSEPSLLCVCVLHSLLFFYRHKWAIQSAKDRQYSLFSSNPFRFQSLLPYYLSKCRESVNIHSWWG